MYRKRPSRWFCLPLMLSGNWVSILSRVLLTRTNTIRPDWAHMWWTGYWGVYPTLCLANMGRSFSRSALINTVVPACRRQERQSQNCNSSFLYNRKIYLFAGFLILVENGCHFLLESRQQTASWVQVGNFFSNFLFWQLICIHTHQSHLCLSVWMTITHKKIGSFTLLKSKKKKDDNHLK